MKRFAKIVNGYNYSRVLLSQTLKGLSHKLETEFEMSNKAIRDACAYQGVRSVVFLENFVYALNE